MFRAFDPQRGYDVALKVLRGNPARLREEAEREAALWKRLDHPNIVPFLEWGEADGQTYLVSRYCEGLPLDRWIREERGALKPTVAAQLIADLALVVQYAHDQGLIHRDIKPANVIVHQQGDRLVPYLIDFGLARLRDTSPEATLAFLTAPGHVKGTVPYMAPEQIRLAIATPLNPEPPIDYRVDIYGLGATLYELLTGRPPVTTTDLRVAFHQILHVEPQPPREVSRDVSAPLQWVCLKCLEKDPNRRYASAQQLHEALSDVVAGRPQVPRHTSRPTVSYRLRRWVRNHPTQAVATAALILLLALSLGFSASLYRVNRRMREAIHVSDRTLHASRLEDAATALRGGDPRRAQESLRSTTRGSEGDDLRGFAWHYLWNLSRRQVISFDDSGDTAPRPASPDHPIIMRSPNGGTREPYVIEHIVAQPGEQVLYSINVGGRLVEWDLKRHVFGHALASEIYVPSDLAIDPDGRRVAAWHMAGFGDPKPSILGAWELETGRKVLHQVIPGIEWTAGIVFADPDHVVSRFGEKGRDRLRVWKLDQGEPASQPSSRLGEERAQMLSRDGRVAAVWTEGFLSIYDTVAAAKLFEWPTPEESSHLLALSEDGGLVALRRDPESVSIHDSDTGRELSRFRFESDREFVSFAASSRYLLSRIRGGPLIVQRVVDGAEVRRGEGTCRHLGDAIAQVTSDGARLLANHDERIELWELATGRTLSWPVRPLATILAPDERSAIISDGPKLHRWVFDPSPFPDEIVASLGEEAWAVAWSPDGSRLVTGADTLNSLITLRVWDESTFRPLASWDGHGDSVTSVAFSPDGQWLASASFATPGNIKVWDTRGWKEVAALDGHREGVYAIAFRPDGRVLASASRDSSIALWDVAGRKLIAHRDEHDERVHTIAFSPDGRWLASAAEDGLVHLRDPNDGAIVRSYNLGVQLLALAFSPDSATLAVTGFSGAVSVLDLSADRWVHQLRTDEERLHAITFSPDGRTLAAGGKSGRIQLWDPLTGDEMLVLEGHSAQVNSLAFSPDGRTLASCDHAGEVRLWRGSPEE